MNTTANHKIPDVSEIPENFSMSGILEIDLSAIQKNFQLCDQQSHDTCETAAVVKANAYGLGIDRVAPALWNAGARIFFVATFEEGAELRRILPEARIAILNGILPGLESSFESYDLIPVLNNAEQAKIWSGYAQSKQSQRHAILHVDTGMNRLGFRPDELLDFLSDDTALSGITIDTIMSHFVMAEDRDHPKTDSQFVAFETLYEALSDRYKFSLSNAYGLFRNDKYHFHLTRPGMALYGLHVNPKSNNPMHPVVNLSVPVLQVHEAKKNETAGYSATHIFEKDMPLATVSLGYADGFFRSFSNQGHLYFNGQACPVVGRVSMDLVILDISSIPESQRPKVGDMVEVIGENQSADDLAAQGGTIGYEVLTSLGSRYKRVYKNA